MRYTLQLRGAVPCKKNRWHRGRNGGMYFDEPEQKRGNIQSLLDALQFQAQSAWGRPALSHVHMYRAVFYAANPEADADGMHTTLLDVLVRARVLENDNIRRVPRQQIEAQIVAPGEERVVVELEA